MLNIGPEVLATALKEADEPNVASVWTGIRRRVEDERSGPQHLLYKAYLWWVTRL